MREIRRRRKIILATLKAPARRGMGVPAWSLQAIKRYIESENITTKYLEEFK